jgi:NAD(P)-dependent dehydrogenase (short-subunit alcohol dehydrogenase family)
MGAAMAGRALVTGAARRLGRAMALCLADRGFDVAVHYAGSAGAAEETAAEIRGMGRRAVALQADLLDETAAAALLPRAAAALGGPLGVLVNNASIFEHDTIHSATAESWNRHIGSNLRAPFLLTQAFAAQGLQPATDAAGEPVASGLIVNLIDQRVLKPTPEFMTYTLAKMGLWALTRTTAQALAPAIRVNAIGPGPTLQGARQSPAHFAGQRAATVLGRGADAGDIVAALGYLLDARAVTGQLICVDGGQHLGWQTPDVQGVE